jgi:hypothetical protein
MFLFTVRTYIRSIETEGHALNLRFATMFSRDAITLAISDAVLVATTGLCVPFAKALSSGWIKYQWTGLIVQHLFQTTILVIAITWTFNRYENCPPQYHLSSVFQAVAMGSIGISYLAHTCASCSTLHLHAVIDIRCK